MKITETTMKIWFITDSAIAVLGGIGTLIVAKLISLVCWANWPDIMTDWFIWGGHDIIKTPLMIGAYGIGHLALWWYLWEQRMLLIIENMRAQK